MGYNKIEIADVTPENGNLPVAVQDQYTPIVNGFLVNDSGVPLPLAAPIVKESYTITLQGGHSVTIGNQIFIRTSTRSHFATVLGVATNVLTLDSRVPFDAPVTGTFISTVVNDMRVDGSVTAVGYTIGLPGTVVRCFDITGLRFHIECTTEPDDSKFGNIAALTRGVAFRQHFANGDIYQHALIKTNGDLNKKFDNLKYSDKSGGGKFSVLSDWKVREELGVTQRIEPGEKIEILIQDDLTDSALTGVTCWAYGHEVIN